MTKEDQRYVALAALAGVRFSREGGYWLHNQSESAPKISIGRSAVDALFSLGHITMEERNAYDYRSWGDGTIQEVDMSLLEGVQLNTEECIDE